MSLVVNSNTTATVTRNYLNTNQTNLQTSLARLASGSRIVKPSDDAGGLAVGNKLLATLNRNIRGQQNTQNAISFLQVQDGALSTVGKILDRMSELKTMSLDVTKNSLDIANYDAEFSQLQEQLSNIRDEKFNGINLFQTEGRDLQAVTTEMGDEGVVQVENLATITGDSAAQVDTLTISGGSVGVTYEVDINGTTFSQAWTADDATTATALVAAINANAAMSGNDALGNTNITAAATGGGALTLTAGSATTHIETRVADDGNSSTISAATTTKGDTLALEIDGYNYNFGIGGSIADLVTAINGSSLGSILTAAADGAGTGVDLTAKKSADRYSLNVNATSTSSDITAGVASGTAATLNQSTTTEATIISVGLSREGVYRTDTNGAGLITTSGVNLLDEDRTLAKYSVDDFTNFIQNAATARADNGAEMSRLESSYSLLTVNHANIEAARSRLMDVDIAIESTHFAKHNILVQSSAAMLSQANGIPNVALQLLG